MKKIDWLVIALLVIISIFVLKDLFKPGMYTSHDGVHQVVRFYYFDQLLAEGQFPPRFVGGLLNGFGYPLFTFSYHLPWFIAEIIRTLGASIIDSVKLTFLVGFIFSGITMYFFQRELFGRLAAIAGTTLYLFAPYRFSNIFVRAAIGDATSFVFPPLLFLSIIKLRDKKQNVGVWLVLGGLSIAGLILSHAMVFLFFFASFLGFILFSFINNKDKKQFLVRAISMILLGFGFSSYYFLPSIFERSFTKFNEIMGGVFLGSTFLNLKDLIYSPWGYGMMRAYEGGMSFQIGFAQWLAFFLALIVFLFYIIKRTIKSKDKETFFDALFFILIFILSIILMLDVSMPVWRIINNIVVIDFTWRVLALIVFSTAFLAGFVISKIKAKSLIAITLITLALYANRNHTRINQSLDWDLPFMLLLEKTTNSFDEYTPKWVNNDMVKNPKSKVEFSAPANITIGKQKSHDLSFILQSTQSGIARINTVYYPGWKVTVDGRDQKIDYSSGFIEFPVDKNAKVTAKFGETPLRLFSDMISLGSIVLGIYLLIKDRFKLSLLK